MPRRRKKEEEQFGAPAYMTTYGDMMTLLLCFFVVLFSFSEIDKRKFEHLSAAFKSGLGLFEGARKFFPRQGLVQKLPRLKRRKKKLKKHKELQIVQKIVKKLKKEIQMEQVQVKAGDLGIEITIQETPLFPLGEARLLPSAKKLLDKIAEILKSKDLEKREILIKGHTDKLPIHTWKYPSNWELSVMRAVNVLRYFEEKSKIPSNRLAAMGYGEHRPLPGTENLPLKAGVGIPRNRRIEIMIFKEGIPLNIKYQQSIKPTKGLETGLKKKKKKNFLKKVDNKQNK